MIFWCTWFHYLVLYSVPVQSFIDIFALIICKDAHTMVGNISCSSLNLYSQIILNIINLFKCTFFYFNDIFCWYIHHFLDHMLHVFSVVFNEWQTWHAHLFFIIIAICDQKSKLIMSAEFFLFLVLIRKIELFLQLLEFTSIFMQKSNHRFFLEFAFPLLFFSIFFHFQS